MISRREVILLIDQIHQMDLERSDWFDDKTDLQLQQNFNGVGPDWMPDDLREVLSEYLEFFMPAVLIHDADFTWMEKTHPEFNLANKRLYRNCKKIISYKIPWWRIGSRLRRYAQARAMYRACDQFGIKAFTS